MPDFKNISKGGWHPKGKDGKSSESWRGDFKGIGQVAGWMGKGKGPNAEAEEHISRPLSSLKDPAAFGPPPKNVNYHGGAALPNQITPDTGGWGAPLSKEQMQAKQREEEEEEAQRQAEEAAQPPPPPRQYRVDTTGLSTANLPPPPGRKDGADGRSPMLPPPGAKPKPPGLPPRLPPRQNSATSPSPPPPYASEPPAPKGILNQSSMSRLGAAGVSVPGFGIGKQSPVITSSSSPAPSSTNASQLNELQYRFSRLGSSPKPDSATEGTTFAQKQSALKTASSFRKDPSSVSLSDARNAASTANNFRERHGDQVKSGWQSANKLNTNYGISDKLGSYSGNAQPEEPASPLIEMRDNTGPEPVVLGKKKPPPPPVKRAELTSPSIGRDAAPPIPLSSKPKPSVMDSFRKRIKDNHEASDSLRGRYNARDHKLIAQAPSIPRANIPDLDLDLKSGWYAKSPPVFPPASINRLPGKRSYASSSGWLSSGVRKTFTFTGAIRDNATLDTTIIHLTWDGSNPEYTVKGEQRHIPPPRKLSSSELESYRERYSDDVAEWSISKMGQQVGDGECWTLANNALAAVGTLFSSRGQEPCMSSQSYVHGALIYSFIPVKSPYPEPGGGVLEAGVARGDVIQLYEAHFKSKDGRREAWAGAPDHTAVIIGVEPNGILRVVEQNVGGVKRVRDGSYDMSELVKGEVRIFRAVGESWVGKLEPKW